MIGLKKSFETIDKNGVVRIEQVAWRVPLQLVFGAPVVDAAGDTARGVSVTEVGLLLGFRRRERVCALHILKFVGGFAVPRQVWSEVGLR